MLLKIAKYDNTSNTPPIYWWCMAPICGKIGDGLLLLYQAYTPSYKAGQGMWSNPATIWMNQATKPFCMRYLYFPFLSFSVLSCPFLPYPILLPIYLSTYLPTYLSIYLSFCLIYPSYPINPIYPIYPIYPILSYPIHPIPSHLIDRSIYLSIYLSIYPNSPLPEFNLFRAPPLIAGSICEVGG